MRSVLLLCSFLVYGTGDVAAAPALATLPGFGAIASVHAGAAIDGGPGHIDAEQSAETHAPFLATTRRAAASLADGTLKAGTSAAATGRPPASPLEYVARASMWDTLVFHNGGAISLLPTWLAIDGVLSGWPWATARARWYVGYDPDYLNKLASLAPWHALSDGEATLAGDDLFLPLGDATMYAYFEVETRIRPQVDFATIADFGNTLHFGWELPFGVSVDSASGVFMHNAPAALPQPGTLALLGAVLLANGGLRRRVSAGLPARTA